MGNRKLSSHRTAKRYDHVILACHPDTATSGRWYAACSLDEGKEILCATTSQTAFMSGITIVNTQSSASCLHHFDYSCGSRATYEIMSTSSNTSLRMTLGRAPLLSKWRRNPLWTRLWEERLSTVPRWICCGCGLEDVGYSAKKKIHIFFIVLSALMNFVTS